MSVRVSTPLLSFNAKKRLVEALQELNYSSYKEGIPLKT
jgi:hypothetical protein